MRRPLGVLSAVTLARVYAVVLAAVAAAVAYEALTGTGRIGHQHFHGRAAAGVPFLVVALLDGAAYLVVGAQRVIRMGRTAMLVAPLAVLLGIGTIGETVDCLGTATATSDLTGAGILILAALPLYLLLRRPSRAWTAGIRTTPTAPHRPLR